MKNRDRRSVIGMALETTGKNEARSLKMEDPAAAETSGGGTALVLGGGGARGAYEIGVWKALRELGIEINMVFGTSVGAINAAMVAQGDTDNTARLWSEIETDKVFDVPQGAEPVEYIKEMVIHNGAGTTGLKELLTRYVDEPGIRNSGIRMGLTVTEVPKSGVGIGNIVIMLDSSKGREEGWPSGTRELAKKKTQDNDTEKPENDDSKTSGGLIGRYAFLEDIPEGRLIDYIVASSSAYPAIHSHEIDGREYVDGGYFDCVPVTMANMEGADEVIAVSLNGFGPVYNGPLEEAKNLRWIESSWELGSQLTFSPENSERIMRLGYLDALKCYGVYDGHFFTFAKGSFDKTTTAQADSAAKIFGLDPEVIYTREVFLKKLKNAVDNPGNYVQEELIKYAGRPAKSFSEFQKRFTANAEFIKGFSDPQKLSGRLSQDIRELSGDKLMTFIIANSLKDKDEKSPFITGPAVKLFREPLNAARFLVKQGW